MPRPAEDPTTSRTGEMPRVPTEAEMRVEADAAPPPVLPVDLRSETGVYRFHAEARSDAPCDVDKPTPHKDSPA